MNHTRLRAAVVAASLLVVALGAWTAGARQSGGAMRPAVIGVVDLQQLINSVDELQTRQRELDKFSEDMKARVQAKDRAVRDAQEALKVLPEGTPEHRAKAEELRRLTLELKFEGEFAVNSIDERRGEVFAQIFRKALDAASRLGKQAGYDVIMSNDSVATMPGIGPENAMRQLIVQRRILWASETVDITDELITMMNNEHKAGAGGR